MDSSATSKQAQGVCVTPVICPLKHSCKSERIRLIGYGCTGGSLTKKPSRRKKGNAATRVQGNQPRDDNQPDEAAASPEAVNGDHQVLGSFCSNSSILLEEHQGVADFVDEGD